MDPNRFATHSLRDSRILRIVSSALEAVDPGEAVKKFCPPLRGRVYGLGIGKAAVPMMTALATIHPLSGALAISKHGSDSNSNLFPILLGAHPIPDERSVHAGTRALEFVSTLTEEDTLVCLISGGGSALVTAPFVPLADLQTLTSFLLSCGARIDEINLLRRRLDRIKGGGLARATRANVISLILSDVIGNPLETIASGPTVPDPATRQDAVAILDKYDRERTIPASIYHALHSSPEGTPSMDRVENIIVGDNRLAAQAAADQAQREGFAAEILTNELQGEAREVGAQLVEILRRKASEQPRPFCLIAGGETTVTLRGSGKGGRNQELALAAVNELDGLEHVLLIALATDGEDGPTDAGGAVVTGESKRRAESLGIDAADHLSRNDAYVFFEALGDLIRSGPTGTNVNDLIFLIAL